jgi:hypothetical protein
MGNELMTLWVAWWVGATLLTLGLIVFNVRRRRRIARSGTEESLRTLPTWREDALWGALAVVGGGVGLAVLLLLLRDGHTARGFLAAAIIGLIMLLGLLMLLKNGVAPNDVLRLDQDPLASAASDASESERLHYRNARTDF